MSRFFSFKTVVFVLLTAIQLGGCSTAPKAEDKTTFLARAALTTGSFNGSVAGLREQIENSGGYIVFPDVAQWGFLFAGGTYGRGALYSPDGKQLGWSAINVGSIGLQAGVQGFRMLMVLESQEVLDELMANKLSGSVAGVAVAAEEGGSVKASFTNGVAVYQGANTGLMAGINVGLNYIRYEPLYKPWNVPWARR
jgi:lipid-binding SYLF domain-containing protein